MKVHDLMSIPAATCAPDDELETAMMIMGEEQVRRLPVVSEDGRLQGVISMNDLILFSAHDSSDSTPPITAERVVETLRRISRHWLPTVSSVNGVPERRKSRGSRRRAAAR